MRLMPQTEAISNFKNRCEDVLTKLRQGPVLLMQRSQPAAVLIDPEAWNQHVVEMRNLRLLLLYYKRREAVRADPTSMVSDEELERQLQAKIKALA
ncbi:MAG: hypothetical protein M3Q45_07620 [Chloroflexota bacterium]|nr:hypothetical protein [Chloroflexota bacterium]